MPHESFLLPFKFIYACVVERATYNTTVLQTASHQRTVQNNFDVNKTILCYNNSISFRTFLVISMYTSKYAHE